MRSIFFLCAGLLLPGAACTRPSPEAAVQALAAAARDGDRAEVVALLGPRTRSRLIEDARVASEQAGRRHIAPGDLLVIGWAPPADEVGQAHEVGRDGARALVELVGRGGSRQRLEVVREDGVWKVELP